MSGVMCDSAPKVAVEIVPMQIWHAMAIDKQPSQRLQVGLETHMTPEAAQELIDYGEAWAAIDGDRVVSCMGIRETFPGRQGVAWAILAEGVGTAHLAITRHARRRIAESPLVRIEAIVRTGVAAECIWAKLVGLQPVALLRKFGALSEDHMLFERIA